MSENKVLLSILIPTIVGREEQFNTLLSNIFPFLRAETDYKYNGIELKKEHYKWHIGELADTKVIPSPVNIEIVSLKDSKQITIGEKRELLYQLSNGLYSWQIDDDDDIAPNAIQLILEAIKSNPDVDCITFEEHIYIDGKIQRSNHSLKYDDWANDTDGFDYVRTPFMKSVIKTEIAKSVPIPHIRFGEDHQWAQALKPHLKTEIHIDEQLYKYIHRSTNPTERYGLDKN